MLSPRPVIVAIRLRQFGDVLATLGALEALKAQWPEGRVVYVVDERYHPLLRGVAFVDELFPSPPRVTGAAAFGSFVRYVARLRAMRPAAVVDFHGNARSAFVALLTGAKARAGFAVRGRRHAYTTVEPRAVFEGGVIRSRNSLESALALVARLGVAVPDAALPPRIEIDEALVQRSRGRLASVGVPARAIEEGRVVGINPGLPYPAKAWPLDRWVALAKRLVERGRHVVVLWGPGEQENALSIVERSGRGTSVAPPTTLEELAGVVKALSLVVTIDSGLKHLAVCLRVPTVTLFGSTDPREWHVGTPDDRWLWRGLSCSPCRLRACPFGTPCMDIETREVLEAIDSIEGAR